MKYFELSSFGTNKLFHLLSDFWIYQKYPSPFDVQDSYFNMGGWGEGWRFVCVCVRVYLCVVQHTPTVFVFEFCNLKLDFRFQKQSRLWKKTKIFGRNCAFLPLWPMSPEWCEQSLRSNSAWGILSWAVLRRPPLSSGCPEVGSSLKGLALCNSVKNTITRTGMTVKNRSLFSYFYSMCWKLLIKPRQRLTLSTAQINWKGTIYIVQISELRISENRVTPPILFIY